MLVRFSFFFTSMSSNCTDTLSYVKAAFLTMTHKRNKQKYQKCLKLIWTLLQEGEDRSC